MGLRTKAYFSGMFLAFFSSIAAALGLGEIKLQSALNQPLNAEIQLLHVRGLTANEIIIGIATPEEFARAGVERNYFVTGLDFALDLNAQQGPIIRVTSREPVREPFLNFVVSAHWPSGRLLREYTLLVDLPVFSGAQSAPVQAPRQTQSQPASTSPSATPRSTPPPTQAQPPREAPSQQVSSYAADTYGPVGSNDTLWSIAAKIRPDGSVSVQQTMLAIQRMNPEAFINDNINLLRRGQVLRIPDKEEIQRLSTRDAIQQVAAQNQRWNPRSSDADKAQLEGSKSVSPTRSEPSTIEGRVKLSSPSDAQTGQGIGSEDGDGESVAEVLSQTQEELDAADRENADLKSRIRSVEEQIDTMERLVEISSEEMRALELAAQQTNQDVAAEVEPTAAQEGADAEPVASAEEASAPAESTPAAEPKPVQAPPAQKSWLDLAMDNILYIGIALGALILALVIYLFKRNRDEDYDDYDDYEAQDDVDLSLVEEEYTEDKTLPLHDYDDGEGFVEEEPAIAEAETEDVVGECDIHIAYGQYDQAEEKLLRALEKDPGNISVRLKLLEVFSRQSDADSFDQHYARLRATGDAAAIDRAEMMRSSIEGIGPFEESLYNTSDLALDIAEEESGFETASENSFDLADDDTLDFDFEDVDELVDSSGTVADADELAADSLDFDLTDDEDITQIPPLESAPNVDDELAELDFDLEDLEESVSDQSASAAFVADRDSEDTTALADLDFEASETESFDDEKVADEPADDLDLEFDGNDRFTSEFTDDLVAERAAPKDEESFDFADLELGDADGAESGFTEELGEIDFDLDDDLEAAQTLSEEPPVLSSTAPASDAEFSGFDLDDLADVELDDEQASVTPRADSGVAANLEAEEGSTSDFDVNFDLDGEVNLDELDHELDELASNYDSTEMEEPVLDFDDETDTVAKAGNTSTDEALADSAVAEKDADQASVAASVDSTSMDFEIPDFDPENDDDSNLDFLSDNDETATKLDLARAYIDMGDSDGAKDILDEIIDEGNDQQKREAEALLSRIA